MKKLIIAYGSKNVTLNKGKEHFLITKKELAFIVESAIRNNEVSIKAKPTK